MSHERKLQEICAEAEVEFVCEKDGVVFFRAGRYGDPVGLDAIALKAAPDVRLAVSRSRQGEKISVRHLSAKRKRTIYQLKLAGKSSEQISDATNLSLAVVMEIISEGETNERRANRRMGAQFQANR